MALSSAFMSASCATCLVPLIRRLPPVKFNPSDPLPHLGIDQIAVFAKCGHDPSVAGKLIFAPDAKAAVPKGFDKLAITSLSDLPVASIEPLADEAALAHAFVARAAHITPFALCEAAECAIVTHRHSNLGPTDLQVG